MAGVSPASRNGFYSFLLRCDDRQRRWIRGMEAQAMSSSDIATIMAKHRGKATVQAVQALHAGAAPDRNHLAMCGLISGSVSHCSNVVFRGRRLSIDSEVGLPDTGWRVDGARDGQHQPGQGRDDGDLQRVAHRHTSRPAASSFAFAFASVAMAYSRWAVGKPIVVHGGFSERLSNAAPGCSIY